RVFSACRTRGQWVGRLNVQPASRLFSLNPRQLKNTQQNKMPFAPNHPQPKVSIGILTRNAGPLFHRVIDALINQQTDLPFEIVILDSASKDDTVSFAESKNVKAVPYRPAKFRFGSARDYLFD